MYKTVTVLIISLFFVIACSPKNGNKDAIMQFVENEHDFGALALEREVEYSFEFSNLGENALLIYDVKTSCGCTVAEWPQKPIKPKESGKITVKYDSEYPGMFHKEITVYYNGEDSPAVLAIKGQVEYPEEQNIAKE